MTMTSREYKYLKEKQQIKKHPFFILKGRTHNSIMVHKSLVRKYFNWAIFEFGLPGDPYLPLRGEPNEWADRT